METKKEKKTKKPVEGVGELKEFTVSVSRNNINLLRQCIDKFEESDEVYFDLRAVSDDFLLNHYKGVVVTVVSLNKYLGKE